jgi:hypothetical protein
MPGKDRLRELAPLVATLESLKPKQRRQLLENCNKKHLKGFEEVCCNICKNPSLRLTQKQLLVCKKWRKPIKLLALRKHPLKAKKQILLQKGGFIGALIPLIATALGIAAPYILPAPKQQQ